MRSKSSSPPVSVDPRRRVPRTDTVLADPAVAAAVDRLGRTVVKQAVVEAQQRVRGGDLDPDAVIDAVLAALPVASTSLRPVLNGTGVLLHTNLGRAPLGAAAREALAVAAGTCDVELDLRTGTRGRRGSGLLAALIAAVPGAAAAHVANNGAAALALVAAALAAGREIVVSRGELVEIGDGFRIPELLESVGARLREVGTTNRTHLADYERALGPDTAFVLKVHPSNFEVTGFTSTVPPTALAALPVPLVVDIGSGLLAPNPLLPDEPDAESVLRAGAAVVTASGDKLLGGPQAGLVLGGPGEGAALVERVRRFPLARAMRVDKLTLAALEATVRGPASPVRAALEVSVDELRARAERIAAALRAGEVHVVDSVATVGGGGAPGVTLPSVALTLPEAAGPLLRTGAPAVLGRFEGGRLLVDLRAIPPADDATLLGCLRRVVDVCPLT